MQMGEKRTIRLSGGLSVRATSVRLEKPFWDALDQMTAEAECSQSQLISSIDSYFRKKGKGVAENRTLASCLRVICLKWSASRARSKPSASDEKFMEKGGLCNLQHF